MTGPAQSMSFCPVLSVRGRRNAGWKLVACWPAGFFWNRYRLDGVCGPGESVPMQVPDRTCFQQHIVFLISECEGVDWKIVLFCAAWYSATSDVLTCRTVILSTMC